jgi:hypothetical protein
VPLQEAPESVNGEYEPGEIRESRVWCAHSTLSANLWYPLLSFHWMVCAILFGLCMQVGGSPFIVISLLTELCGVLNSLLDQRISCTERTSERVARNCR